MASTKYLIVAAVLVAGANAAKFWDDKDNDAFFKNPFKIPKMDFPEMPKMDFPKMHKMDFPEFGEFPKMKKFKMPKFEPITFKPFEPITFEPIVIEPIDVDKMKTYTPKDGEQYVAMSSSSHSSSKTVNGKTVSQGGSEMIVNDNGEVSQEGAVFKAGDPDV